MATATIYATGTHKQKENYGCFGVGILSGRAKKTKDSIGQFDSQSKTETQLNILIYAVALAVEDETVDEIKVFSDFALIKNITDGSIDLWESNNWKKEKGTALNHVELWSELFDLLQKFDIAFSFVDATDKKMDLILKKVKSETKKEKKTIALFEDEAVDVDEVTESTKANEEKIIPIKVEPKQTKQKKQVKEVLVATSSKTEEKEASTPVVVEESISQAEKRVKSATVPTEKIEKNMFVPEDSTIKIDAELKAECEKLFGELGMPLEVAINLFLKDSLRKKGLTINLKLDD